MSIVCRLIHTYLKLPHFTIFGRAHHQLLIVSAVTLFISYFRVKADISRAAAQYLVEHDIGKSEQEIREGIAVMIVGLPSPTRSVFNNAPNKRTLFV